MAFAARSAAASHVLHSAQGARPGAAIPRRGIATSAVKRVVSTENAAALIASSAALAAAAPALADEVAVEVEEAVAISDAMDLAVQSAEEAIKAAELALESGRVDATVVTAVHEAADAVDAAFAAEQAGAGSVTDVAGAGTEVAADLGAAATAMKQAVSAASASATDASIVDAIQAAAAAIQAAAATAQDVAGQVQELVSPAVPVAKEAASFLASASPATLAEGALAIVAVVYLTPPLAKTAVDRIRGYAGDVIPSTAFDALVSQSGNVLVDIRSIDEKEDTGVPLLPDMDKYAELEFVEVGDDRLEERLRNSTQVEAELTAVELAALKQLNRGQTLYLLDQRGNTAKAVARELTKRGFNKVFVVTGGCDAWAAAKLRTKPWEGEGFDTLRPPSALDEIIQVTEKLGPLAENLELPEKVKVST